jgi:hypothetical protein
MVKIETMHLFLETYHDLSSGRYKQGFPLAMRKYRNELCVITATYIENQCALRLCCVFYLGGRDGSSKKILSI